VRRSLVTAATVALVAAGAAGLRFLPQVSCENLPAFHVVVGGATPAQGQISGAGTVCGALGHGKAITGLDPVRVDPGAEAAVLYDSRVR
jgi:ribose/xylose/arabinose/galactoside ABC-type transport system permease subunit